MEVYVSEATDLICASYNLGCTMTLGNYCQIKLAKCNEYQN